VTLSDRAAAGVSCSACDTALPAGARFCPACGTPVGAGGAERRVVTVLFADLVDSTRLVESLDPEATRARLDAMFRRMAAEVHRLDGSVEKYLGDAILAVFGYPTAHGDDAARAMRAALALRDVARSLSAELTDFPPRLRIGLDTGEVVASAFAGDLRVSGEAVHTAARIQQAAAPDQILASVRTLRAARDSVDSGPARQIVARGKQRPVEVAEVLGLAMPLTGVGGGTIMVDRERDLPRLAEALDRAIRERGLVLLVGEAGVGKTTLAHAAIEGFGKAVRVLWGRCLPEWHSQPWWPLREVLAGAAGVPVTGPTGALCDAIGRLVEAAWPEPETAGTAAAGVCRLIGLEPDERAGPPSQVGARELAATVAGVLGRLAEADPTLVVLEDIHWASRDLLEVAAILVTTSTRSGRQLGFLGIARPEAPALTSEWTAGAGAERIDLASLPAGATSRLLVTTVGQQVNPDVARRVFEASRGNPLFVKEMALAIRDTGAEFQRPPALPLPDSLRGLIGARLDRLPISTKPLLCRAAVVGRWFSLAALATLAPEEGASLERDLQALAAAGLIERLPGHLAGDQERYAFQHALFREVAYSLLPKADRSELHERLASWLHGVREPPEAVAPHLVEAVRLAAEVRAPTSTDRMVAGRAVAACRQAAQRLRDQEALLAAISMLDDALAMAESAGTPAEDRRELRAMRGSFLGAIGDSERALEDLEAATGSERAAIRAQALIELSNLHGVLSDYEGAATLAERGLREARSARSGDLLARALRAKALGPFVSGDLVETARLLEEALELSIGDDRPGLAIDLRLTLLPVRLHLATPLGEVAAQAHELAAAARAHGRRNAEAGANWAMGEVHALQGDLDSAERRFVTAGRQLRDIGLSFQLVWSLLGLARVAIARGAPERARRLAEEAIEITSRPDGVAEPDGFVHLAEAYLAEGDLEAAAATIRRARGSLQPGDVVLHAEVERVEAHLASARGDHQAAAGLLRHALAALAITDYRLVWLRTAAQLVPALVTAGNRDEAAEVAAEVRRHATAIGAHALAQGLPEAVP
jgi:class 3 adenylate cyclase/tetratricopeptide (TPR) repeat protein